MIKRGRPSCSHNASDMVKCGICHKLLRYDNLQRHFNKVHEKQEKFTYSDNAVFKKQKTIDFFHQKVKGNYDMIKSSFHSVDRTF